MFIKKNEKNEIYWQSLYANDLPEEFMHGVIEANYTEPENIQGKTPVPIYDPSSNSIIYNYLERELTEKEKTEQEINSLKEQSELLMLALADVDEQRELDKTEIFLALSEIAEMGGI